MEESLETMTLETVPTRNGSVFVTWTNFGYVDFAVTWAENLRRNGIENMYIGAMDVKTSKVGTFGRGREWTVACETDGSPGITLLAEPGHFFSTAIAVSCTNDYWSHSCAQVLRERGFPTFAMYAKGQNSTGLSTGKVGGGKLGGSWTLDG